MAHRDENDRLMDGDLPLNPFDGAEPVQSPAPKAPLGPLNLGSMFPTARQLEMTGATKTPWLVQDVLLRGGVTYLYGDPKAGKSTVTMAMLLDVAAGVSALLTYAVVEGRALRVLVFSEQPDGSNVDLERVFDPPRQDGRPRHGANVRYLKREASGTLDDLDQVLYLARHAGQHHEADVIVFDTALEWCRGLNGKSLNDAEAMADVGRKFRTLATDLDCAVLLLHHARKSGGEVGLGMLGTAAIRASSDVNILVERLEKHSTGVSLTFERRDPLRLIALAAGRETGRNPRQQFELVLTTTRGPSGDEVEYVQFRPMSRPAADAGSPPAIDTSKIDTELLQTAMQNLAAGQESSDGPPVVSTSQIREEAGRIISAGQSELPDGYAAPGETRIRAAKNALVNSGTWEKLPGNRGFRLAASKAPTPQASSYIPGLARLAAPSLDAGSGE